MTTTKRKRNWSDHTRAKSRTRDGDFAGEKQSFPFMTLVHATPMLADGALQFAFDKATTEGKVTILTLFVLSLFSWSIIITKFRQLRRARKRAKLFFAAYGSTRDPLDIKRKGEVFLGAPAYQLYIRGADELDYHLTKNPVLIGGQTRISPAAFDAVKVTLEEAAAAQALSLEKGMIVLSTAVAGGPFIGFWERLGRHGDVRGDPRANAASLTAMAPGVAGALIATVPGCWSPFRQCSPTTSWSRRSARLPRNWMALRRVTRRKSTTPTWTTAIWRTKSPPQSSESKKTRQRSRMKKCSGCLPAGERCQG